MSGGKSGGHREIVEGKDQTELARAEQVEQPLISGKRPTLQRGGYKRHDEGSKQEITAAGQPR